MGLRRKEAVTGIYAHIPFCIRKCPYCAFNSASAPAEGIPETRYITCLSQELSAVIERENLAGPPATVYLGGGTPSLLSPRAIADFLQSIDRTLGKGAKEITIEANPDTLTLPKLEGYYASGVNRLSIGFQSFEEAGLAALGRTHTVETSIKAYGWARQAGFKNIGIDLIFGTLGQTLRGWEAALEKAVDLKPEHISLYGMTIEEGTPFYRKYGPGKKGLPGEEAEAEMLLVAIRVLKGAGYRHYEVSNFALPGFESSHNTLYWKGNPYIGLGAGAHSYMPWPDWGRRWWNAASANEYMDRVEKRLDPAEGNEELTRKDAIAEAVMLGLRMIDAGINGEAFREKFGNYPAEALSGFKALVADGLLEKKGEDIFVTQKGLLVLDEVALKLI